MHDMRCCNITVRNDGLTSTCVKATLTLFSAIAKDAFKKWEASRTCMRVWCCCPITTSGCFWAHKGGLHKQFHSNAAWEGLREQGNKEPRKLVA